MVNFDFNGLIKGLEELQNAGKLINDTVNRPDIADNITSEQREMLAAVSSALNFKGKSPEQSLEELQHMIDKYNLKSKM